MASAKVQALDGPALDTDREARFAALVTRERDRAVALAYHLTGDREAAKDVAQEAFLRAFRGLGSFREQAQLRTWLFRILTREAARYRRWRAVRRRWAALWGETPEPGPGPDRRAEGHALRLRIAEGLDRLSNGQRTAFSLVHLEGMTVAEAAAVMGRAQGTVKSHLQRALVALRHELRDLSEPS